LVGVAAAAAFSVVVTLVVLKIVDVTVGLRATADEEREGLDITLHGESGYEMGFAAASEPSAVPSTPRESTTVVAQRSTGRSFGTFRRRFFAEFTAIESSRNMPLTQRGI